MRLIWRPVTGEGVVVTIIPGVNHPAVAEQTIALLVSLARNVVHPDWQVRAGVWEPLSSPQIWGQLDSVILSGYIGGLNDESHQDTYVMTVDTSVQLRTGGWPGERIRDRAGMADWKW